MPYIEWTPRFSVDIEEMDSEHRQWLSILNTLFDALNSGKDQQIIGDIIDRMIHYSQSHLSHEEALLENIKYPYLAAHKAEHDKLIRKLDKIKAQSESGTNFRLTVDAIRLLQEWLSNHILITDKKYAQYVKDSVAE